MGDLSKNFSKSEFACRCCGVCDIDPDLVIALQELRNIVGHAIFVNSGYRCEKHNAEVGGSPRSQHMEGTAADIRCNEVSFNALYRYVTQIKAFLNGGIGLYPDKGFIHVDIGPKRSWAYIGGKQVPFPTALNYRT